MRGFRGAIEPEAHAIGPRYGLEQAVLLVLQVHFWRGFLVNRTDGNVRKASDKYHISRVHVQELELELELELDLANGICVHGDCVLVSRG